MKDENKTKKLRIDELEGLRRRVAELEKSETEHKQAEELFRALSSSSPVGIYIVQDGRFQYVNPQFSRYTGYSEDELLGTDSLRLVSPEDTDVVRENAVKMLKGERSAPYEYRMVNKAGETRWILETVASIQYQGIQAALGNYLDITERKRAEEALRESERRFRILIDQTSDAIRIIDEEGRIVDSNREGWECLGYTRDELIGMPLVNINPHFREPEYAERHRQHVSSQSTIYETVHRRKDGREFPVEIRATGITLGDRQLTMGICRDITERKRAEEEQDAISRLGAIITSSLDIQQMYQEFAAQLEKLVGFDRATIVLLDEHGQGVRSYATFQGAGDDLQVEEGIRLKGSALAWLMANKKPHITKDREQERPFPRDAKHLESRLRSSLRVPLISKDKVIGAFNLHSRHPNAYGEREAQILSRVAGQLAVAIANARLYEEQKRRTEELAALQGVNQAVSGSLELEAVASQALEATLNVLGLDAGVIRYVDEAAQEVVLLTERGLPQEMAQQMQANPRLKVGQSLAGRVVQSGEPLVVDDLPHDTRLVLSCDKGRYMICL